MKTLDRARAYTAAVPGAISGSRGHDQTFALACALTWGFALDEQTALVLMLEWNAGCQPPWKESALRRKVTEAMKGQHAKPRGHLLGAAALAHREPLIAPPAERSVWKIKRHLVVAPASAQNEQPTCVDPSELSEAPPVLIGSNSTGLEVADPYTLLDPPVAVPGCAVPRPPELEVDDESWRAVNAAGLADDPVILEALLFFGPDCRVTLTEEAKA